MILVNVTAFVVWRYWTISFPSKSLYLQITAEVNKITKSVRCDLNFIFIDFLETSNSFVKINIVLEIKNVNCFIKAQFYWKLGSIKLHIHADTFNASNCYKLAIVVFESTSPLLKQKFRNLLYTFPTLFAWKIGLVQSYILYENVWLEYCLLYG